MPHAASFLALAVLLGAASAFGSARAQSLTGVNGLVTVPTARMHADGTLTLGSGYVPDRYSTYQPNASQPARAYVPAYASLNLLPSIELGFRFSRALDTGTAEALGDRMFMVRLRLLEERGVVPAVAVGAHDFLRSSGQLTTFFNALYAVASKRLVDDGPPFLRALDVHLGYGTDLIESKGYQFVGPFGGVEVTLVDAPEAVVRRWVVLAEYDGNVATLGQRLGVAPGFSVTTGLQGLEAPIAGIAWQTTL